MKKTRFIEAEIVKAIKQDESGSAVSHVCRDIGISMPTFYN